MSEQNLDEDIMPPSYNSVRSLMHQGRRQEPLRSSTSSKSSPASQGASKGASHDADYSSEGKAWWGSSSKKDEIRQDR